jgi:hypothetical protein
LKRAFVTLSLCPYSDLRNCGSCEDNLS